MSVRVLFFGATADIVGKRELCVLTSGATVSALLDRLISDYPRLADQKLHFALNQEYASRDTFVDGQYDELAIFTAVSGG
jgi:molybdopterin converting factor small subunit